MYRSAPAVFVIWSLAACNAYDPDLGPEPFLCAATEPRCPDGYACMTTAAGKMVCSNGTTSGSGSDASVNGEAGGSCAMPFSGVLATWSLAGQPGTQTSTAAGGSAPGVTAGELKRGGALVAAAGTNSISSSGWSIGALDTTKFYTVTLTAPTGCSLAATSLALDATSSGTGPTSAAVGTSADAFASTTPASTTVAGTVTLTATAAGGMLEIRVYGVGASATTGTMRIQGTLSVTGALQ